MPSNPPRQNNVPDLDLFPETRPEVPPEVIDQAVEKVETSAWSKAKNWGAIIAAVVGFLGPAVVFTWKAGANADSAVVKVKEVEDAVKVHDALLTHQGTDIALLKQGGDQTEKAIKELKKDLKAQMTTDKQELLDEIRLLRKK